MFGQQNKGLECESWYFEERRIGYNQRDVNDYADCDEESREGFEFVVGSKQVLYHLEKGLSRRMLLADEFVGGSC